MNIQEIKDWAYHIKIRAYEGNYAVYETADKSGIIDRKGEIIFPADTWDMCYQFGNDIFQLEIFGRNGRGSGKKMYFDARLRTEVASPELPPRPELPEFAKQYAVAYWCADNRIAVKVKEEDYYGITDEKGNTIVPACYKYIRPANDRIMVTDKNDLQGILDLDGNIIIPFEYPYVGYRRKWDIYTFRTKENKYGCMDTNGKIIIPAVYDHISVGDTYGFDEMAVIRDGRCYFINAKQEEVKVF